MKINRPLLTLLFVLFSSTALAEFSPALIKPRTFQIISAGPDSLARGQTLRYSWGNLNDPALQRHDFEPTSLQFTLFSPDGTPVRQAAMRAVGAGQFQSVDFNRDEIPLPGDPETGLLPVRLEIVVSGILNNRRLDQAGILATFDDHAEVIDNFSGKSTVSQKPKEIVVVGSKSNPPRTADVVYQDLVVPVGLGAGQTLRLSVALPDSEELLEEYDMTVVPVLFDAAGEEIARRDPVTLKPGEFYSFDFERAELPPGEDGTDRLEVRAQIEREFSSELVARVFQGKAPGSLEVLDDGPVKAALLIPIVQAARRPGPTPTPTPRQR